MAVPQASSTAQVTNGSENFLMYSIYTRIYICTGRCAELVDLFLCTVSILANLSVLQNLCVSQKWICVFLVITHKQVQRSKEKKWILQPIHSELRTTPSLIFKDDTLPIILILLHTCPFQDAHFPSFFLLLLMAVPVVLLIYCLRAA